MFSAWRSGFQIGGGGAFEETGPKLVSKISSRALEDARIAAADGSALVDVDVCVSVSV